MAWAEGLGKSDPISSSCSRINRGERVQIERRDRLLMHLIQHQIHHRGQAHAMLSGTRIKPPQLDEFFPIGRSAVEGIRVYRSGLVRGNRVGTAQHLVEVAWGVI
jgi:hypothetical protein